MKFLLRLLTWWNGCTLGMQIFTYRNGLRVGNDGVGNVYYQTRDGRRRWVIYTGESEASSVPPEWHGWLHHTWRAAPTISPVTKKTWEKPHVENLTGTSAAYAPIGSLRRKSVLISDYESWSPE